MKEGRFRLDVREKLYYETGEVLVQAAQRGFGCPISRGFKAKLDGALGSLV